MTSVIDSEADRGPDVERASERGPANTAVPARRLRRRRSLPGGRALVGGFLVAVAGVGVFAAYLDATAAPTTTWVVAAEDVTPGDELTTAQLGVVLADLPLDVAARAHDDVEELVGAVATAPLARGELVQESHVAPGASTPGRDEVSVPVPAQRALAGDVAAGERVDVLVTHDGVTDVVVREAPVISADGAEGSFGGSGEVVVTLALEPGVEALAVVHAVQTGEVTLVRPVGRDLPAEAPWRFPVVREPDDDQAVSEPGAPSAGDGG